MLPPAKNSSPITTLQDDNWAKGNLLLEENKQLMLQMTEARTQIYSIISPLAD